MKIRVTTDRYEYQGLEEGSVHENVSPVNGVVVFESNGKEWFLLNDMYEVVEDGISEPERSGPIKSDGGSSTYYDLPLSEWLLYTLNERQKEGRCYIKTEEMISAFLSNDFDYGNLFKSMIRCKGLQDGTGGKAGNSVEYECNKMIYSVNKIKEKK